MGIPNNYEYDDDDKDDKDEKVVGDGGFNRPPAPGRLAQTSTPKRSAVGRTKRTLPADVLHNIAEPTLLVPAPKGPHPSSLTMTTTTIPRGLPFGGIKITLVATSSTPCHFLTVDVRGIAYGWGRKKYSQPGSLFLFSSLS